MVAPHHPTFRSVGSRPLGSRPSGPAAPFPGRHHRPGTASSRGECAARGSRPPLRLVVDNTVGGLPASAEPVAHPAEGGLGAPSVSAALGSWIGEYLGLLDARWRLWRLRARNRYGNLGVGRRIVQLAPVVALVAAFLFVALSTLRFVQESSSAESPLIGGVVVESALAPGSAAGPAAETSAGSAVLSAGSAVLSAGSAVVIVHPGDSLWSIATSRFPDHDPRRVVDAFAEANGGSSIQSGQQLVIPASLVDN